MEPEKQQLIHDLLGDDEARREDEPPEAPADPPECGDPGGAAHDLPGHLPVPSLQLTGEAEDPQLHRGTGRRRQCEELVGEAALAGEALVGSLAHPDREALAREREDHEEGEERERPVHRGKEAEDDR